MLSGGLGVILLSLLAAVSVGGIAAAIFYPKVSGSETSDKRLANISSSRRSVGGDGGAEQTRQRRKQVQETLKQLEEKQRAKRKRVSLRTRIEQTGLPISVKMFWFLSVAFALVVALLVLAAGFGGLLSVGAGFVAGIGVPRWLLAFLKRRRLNKFLDEFANAIDVVVRGIKAGLPVNDSFRVVAQEAPDPVGPEFESLVEGQRVGIPLDQGLERMYERIPLAEVNFLAIVITIQQRTGGNLAEALTNLSTVLRDRKKMKGKIRAMSQEAKASAAIIGALPIVVMVLIYVTSPDYISLLWTERLGQVMLVGCGIWMTMGILVMRKMINFDF